MIDQQSLASITTSTLSRDSASSVDIIKILDKLEQLVEDSVQFMGRAVWVNADEFFVHTNKIRAFLPEEMKRASRISLETEQMLDDTRKEAAALMEDARDQARRYLQEAQARASQAVSTSELKRQAEAQAKEIIADAERQAAGIRRGADEYAQEVLASLGNFLRRVHGTVERGRAKLEAREGASLAK